MAMKPCRECKTLVSDEAKTCPKCGIKKPVKKTSLITWIALFIVVSVTISIMFSEKSPQPSSAASVAKPATSAAQEHQFEIEKGAAVALIILKNGMRNPQSFELIEALQMKDETICFKYRAQNGFGGINVEHALLTKGKLLAGDSDERINGWNRHCANKTGTIIDDKIDAIRAAAGRSG